MHCDRFRAEYLVFLKYQCALVVLVCCCWQVFLWWHEVCAKGLVSYHFNWAALIHWCQCSVLARVCDQPADTWSKTISPVLLLSILYASMHTEIYILSCFCWQITLSASKLPPEPPLALAWNCLLSCWSCHHTWWYKGLCMACSDWVSCHSCDGGCMCVCVSMISRFIPCSASSRQGQFVWYVLLTEPGVVLLFTASLFLVSSTAVWFHSSLIQLQNKWMRTACCECVM